MRLDAVQSVSTIQTSTPQPKPEVQKLAADSAAVQEITQAPLTVESVGNQAASQNKDKPSDAEISNDNERVKKAVSKLNKKIDSNMEAVFGYHDETHRVTIKMVDKESKKVIKEFPAEETLDMIAKVWELAGIMVDEKG